MLHSDGSRSRPGMTGTTPRVPAPPAPLYQRPFVTPLSTFMFACSTYQPPLVTFSSHVSTNTRDCVLPPGYSGIQIGFKNKNVLTSSPSHITLLLLQRPLSLTFQRHVQIWTQ